MPGFRCSPVCLLFSDDKKSDIRSKVWNYLDKNELSQLFAPHKKIPNFKVRCGAVLFQVSYFLYFVNIPVAKNTTKPWSAIQWSQPT